MGINNGQINIATNTIRHIGMYINVFTIHIINVNKQDTIMSTHPKHAQPTQIVPTQITANIIIPGIATPKNIIVNTSNIIGAVQPTRRYRTMGIARTISGAIQQIVAHGTIIHINGNIHIEHSIVIQIIGIRHTNDAIHTQISDMKTGDIAHDIIIHGRHTIMLAHVHTSVQTNPHVRRGQATATKVHSKHMGISINGGQHNDIHAVIHIIGRHSDATATRGI